MNNVYIGNLDSTATEDQVRALLTPHGGVASITVIRNRATRQCVGVALVEMSTDNAAQSARDALDGTLLGERRLEVSRADLTLDIKSPNCEQYPTQLRMQKVGRVQIRVNQRCTVVYERTRSGWTSYSPEMPGCVAAAKTLTLCKARMSAVLKLYVVTGRAIRKVKLIRVRRHLTPSANCKKQALERSL